MGHATCTLKGERGHGAREAREEQVLKRYSSKHRNRNKRYTTTPGEHASSRAAQRRARDRGKVNSLSVGARTFGGQMDKGSPPQGIGVGNLDSLDRHRRWNWRRALARGREQRGHEPRRGRFNNVAVPALQCARCPAVSRSAATLTLHSALGIRTTPS
jgi:hypothetical protein